MVIPVWVATLVLPFACLGGIVFATEMCEWFDSFYMRFKNWWKEYEEMR